MNYICHQILKANAVWFNLIKIYFIVYLNMHLIH